MPATKLTIKRIDALTPRAGAQYVAWDTEVRGFGVRVSPQGTRTYILKYRLPTGRVRWATIERVGVFTLDQARRHARHLLGVVARGADPLRNRDEARHAPTLAEVADRFITDHVAARRKPATLRLYRAALEGHMRPAVGAVSITDVSRLDMLRLHSRLRDTPYMGNRVLAVCSKMFSWAEQHGYRPAGTNPCVGLEKYPEHSRQRYLAGPELQRLGAALRVGARYGRIPPSAATAIRLLLLTGARVNEILSLKWKDVDLTRGALHLPDSKSGRKTIALSAAACELIEASPRFVGSPYVFPGEGPAWRKGAHRVSLADAWSWLRKRARLPDVRLHDLRHNYASVAVSRGQTLPMIGALLGHSQPATTARYAHLQRDPMRVANEDTAGAIAAALSRRRR